MTDYVAVEQLRDLSPFQAELFELVKKHHPDAFKADAEDFFKASFAMAMAMGGLLSTVYVQRNTATGDFAAKRMIVQILETLKANIDPRKALN